MAITIEITAKVNKPYLIPIKVSLIKDLRGYKETPVKDLKKGYKEVPAGAYSVNEYISMVESEYRRNQRLALRNIRHKTVVTVSYADLSSYNGEDYEVVITYFSRYM